MLKNQQKWFFWPKMMVMISGKSAGGAVEVDHLRFRVNGGMCVIYIRIHIYNIYIWYYILYICTKQPTKIDNISVGWLGSSFVWQIDLLKEKHISIFSWRKLHACQDQEDLLYYIGMILPREVQNLKFCCRDGRIVLGRRFEHRAYINCHCNLKGRRGIQLYWVGVYCDLRNH